MQWSFYKQLLADNEDGDDDGTMVFRMRVIMTRPLIQYLSTSRQYLLTTKGGAGPDPRGYLPHLLYFPTLLFGEHLLYFIYSMKYDIVLHIAYIPGLIFYLTHVRSLSCNLFSLLVSQIVYVFQSNLKFAKIPKLKHGVRSEVKLKFKQKLLAEGTQLG